MKRRDALAAVLVAPLATLAASALGQQPEKKAKREKKQNVKSDAGTERAEKPLRELLEFYAGVSDVQVEITKQTSSTMPMPMFTCVLYATVDHSAPPDLMLLNVSGRVYKGIQEVGVAVDLTYDEALGKHKSQPFILTGVATNDSLDAKVCATYTLKTRLTKTKIVP